MPDDGPDSADDARQQVDAARRRLYGGAATEADLDAYLALREDLQGRGDRATAAVSTLPVPRGGDGAETAVVLSSAPPRRRWIIPVVVVAGLVLFGAGLLAGSRATRADTAPSVAAGPPAEPLVATLTRLGRTSGSSVAGGRVVAASDVLDGSIPIQAFGLPPSARIDLVVRCPTRDRSFRASITPVGRLSGTTTLAGPCSGIGYYALPSRDGAQVQVLLTTEGTVRFSAALLLH